MLTIHVLFFLISLPNDYSWYYIIVTLYLFSLGIASFSAVVPGTSGYAAYNDTNKIFGKSKGTPTKLGFKKKTRGTFLMTDKGGKR